MKQLISLLLIISITVISWSSYAKNTAIKVNAIYSQPSTTISSMVIKPSLSNQHANESFSFVSNQVTNKHNSFFELAIIFNEKLQQFIAFFTQFDDEVKEVASNELSPADISPSSLLPSNITSSSNSPAAIQKCKASS